MTGVISILSLLLVAFRAQALEGPVVSGSPAMPETAPGLAVSADQPVLSSTEPVESKRLPEAPRHGVTSALPRPQAALEEIRVVASRPQSGVSAIPSAPTLIELEDFPKAGGNTAGDALAAGGAVGFHKYPGALQSVRLRGYPSSAMSPGESRVAILMDGRPAGGSNMGKFPLEGMERIEVVRGGGSGLYGSSAMGGVVNFVPRRGRGRQTGSIGAEYGSWDHRKLAAAWGGELCPADFFFSATRLTSGFYEVPRLGVRQDGGRDEWSGAFNTGVEFIEGNRLGVLGYGYFGDLIKNPGALYWPEDPDNYARKRFQTGQVQLLGGWEFLRWDQVLYKSRETDDFHVFTAGVETFYMHNHVSYEGGRHLLTADAFELGSITGGVDWERQVVDSYSTGWVTYQPTQRNFNVALLAEALANTPFQPLKLSGGLRQDRFVQKVSQPSKGLPIPGLIGEKRRWDVLTGRGGAILDFEAVRFFGNVSTGFRAPLADETSANYTDPSTGFRYAGNTDLGPERSLMIEGGGSWKAGSLSGSLGYFHTVWMDKIQAYSVNALDRSWKNIDGMVLDGVELQAAAGIPGEHDVCYTPFVNATYHFMMKNTDDEENARTSLRVPMYEPRWFGSAGLKAAKAEGAAGGWRGRVFASAQGVEWQEDFGAEFLTMSLFEKRRNKAFAVWTASASFWPSEGIELWAAVENFMNQRYEYVLDYPMPGTTTVAGVNVSF